MSFTIVIDSGSANTRMGFGGMMEPSLVVASAIGTKYRTVQHSIMDEMISIVGNQEHIAKYSTTHSFKYMLRNGLIQDWDALERLWHTCFYDKLRCDPEEYNFLITESAFNTPENREQTAEIMFETFNVPGLYLGCQPILSLIASWGNADRPIEALTGTVVDAGEDTTTVIPIAEGHIIRNAIQQIPIGGRDITAYVQGLLRSNKRNVHPSQSFDISRQIKERYGYVCSNLAKESAKETERVASGRTNSGECWECVVNEEQYLAGEVLFQPGLLKGSKCRAMSLPEAVDTAIQLCPIDLRRELYGNVVLSSGSAMFPNFARRLQRDVKRIADNRLKVSRSTSTMNVLVSPPIQNHSVWLGGSIVASGAKFHNWITTKEQYEEEGSRIVRQTIGIYGPDFM